MPNRVEHCLQQALDCEAKAILSTNGNFRAMYLELAEQWRGLANQAIVLEGLRPPPRSP
jgi:hypothetical protein